MLALQRKLYVSGLLDICDATLVTKSHVLGMCTGWNAPQLLRMTSQEAEEFLADLCAARRVVDVGQNLLHIRPHEIVQSACDRTLKGHECVIPVLSLDSQYLTTSLAESASTSTMVTALSNRKKFWAWVTLGCCSQMACLAYFTFVVYGWDVMEPVCFFIGGVSMLWSYLFFLCGKTDHTAESVDSILPLSSSKHASLSLETYRQWGQLSREIDEATRRSA